MLIKSGRKIILALNTSYLLLGKTALPVRHPKRKEKFGLISVLVVATILQGLQCVRTRSCTTTLSDPDFRLGVVSGTDRVGGKLFAGPPTLENFSLELHQLGLSVRPP